MNAELVHLIKCRYHRQHPRHWCAECSRAINLNKINNGWWISLTITPQGDTIIWETYQPRISWFGPEAFCGK